MTKGCHRWSDLFENEDETEDSHESDSDSESLRPLLWVSHSSYDFDSDDKASCLEQIYEHPVHENPPYPVIPSTWRSAEGSHARAQDRTNVLYRFNGLKPEDSPGETGILSNSSWEKGLDRVAGTRSENHAPYLGKLSYELVQSFMQRNTPNTQRLNGSSSAGKSAIVQSPPEAGNDNGAHGRPNRASEEAFAEAQQSSHNDASPEEPYTQTQDQGYYSNHYEEPPGPGFFSNAQEFTMNDTNQFDFTGAKDPAINMIGSYHRDNSNHIHQGTGSAAPWAFVAGASIALQVQSILRPTEQSVREKPNDSNTSSGPNVEVDASHLLSTCTLLIMGLRHKLPDVLCSKIQKQAARPHEDAQITRDQSDAYSIQVTYEKVTVSLSTGDGRISSVD